MKLELTEGDSLEVSDDISMYNPHIVPFNIEIILNNYKPDLGLVY